MTPSSPADGVIVEYVLPHCTLTLTVSRPSAGRTTTPPSPCQYGVTYSPQSLPARWGTIPISPAVSCRTSVPPSVTSAVTPPGTTALGPSRASEHTSGATAALRSPCCQYQPPGAAPVSCRPLSPQELSTSRVTRPFSALYSVVLPPQVRLTELRPNAGLTVNPPVGPDQYGATRVQSDAGGSSTPTSPPPPSLSSTSPPSPPPSPQSTATPSMSMILIVSEPLAVTPGVCDTRLSSTHSQSSSTPSAIAVQ